MAFEPHVLPGEPGPGKEEQIQGVLPSWTGLMSLAGSVGSCKWSGREARGWGWKPDGHAVS